jgi:hypothetical protein
MDQTPVRLRDGGSPPYLWASPEVLVRCPRCSHRASVVVDRARLTCAHCGLARDSDQRGVCGRPVDPCFGLPLWLQADFRGHTVWAYNARHLQTLRDYVAANQRERGNTPICPGGPRSESMSMIEKLPAWRKAARNRERVLTVFESLLARSEEI